MVRSTGNLSSGGNVNYVTMQIPLPIPEFTRTEHNLHCDVLHITTDSVARHVEFN